MDYFGSRRQVMNGTAKMTTGRLTKKNLMLNKHGRIVSRKRHATAKKDKRLAKAGFIPKKGVFKIFRKGDGKKKRRGTRKK
jgi:hypothetical protein